MEGPISGEEVRLEVGSSKLEEGCRFSDSRQAQGSKGVEDVAIERLQKPLPRLAHLESSRILGEENPMGGASKVEGAECSEQKIEAPGGGVENQAILGEMQRVLDLL